MPLAGHWYRVTMQKVPQILKNRKHYFCQREQCFQDKAHLLVLILALRILSC